MLLHAYWAQCCWAELVRELLLFKATFGCSSYDPLHQDRWSGIHIEMRFDDVFTSNRKICSDSEYKQARAGTYASPHSDVAEAHLLYTNIVTKAACSRSCIKLH